mmetsp:Transcript_34416/g.67279  ORF Transcript_34416/g.67279 Transcript_34416/m.67279 type:complete len:182 (+) Transcript_34416:36-581(+)
MAFCYNGFSHMYIGLQKAAPSSISEIKPGSFNKESFFGKKLIKNLNKNTLKSFLKKKRTTSTKNWVAVFGPGGGFFGVGTSELLVIGAVAWLVLGPKRLYQLARDIGKISGEIKNVAEEARQTFQQAIDIDSLDSGSQLSKKSLDLEIDSDKSKISKKKKTMKNLDDLVKTEISLSEKKND